MAGGGKVSARQKMINMMYLVLTALLALNVSKEIIKAFNLIENSLDNSTQYSTILLYDVFCRIIQ